MQQLLIKNVHIMDPASREEYDGNILCENGKIVSLGACEAPEGATVIDGSGCIAAPGFVDAHVHFRDPGFTAKEDIYTGAKAAAAGGFTSVIMMANTKPAIDSVETLQYCLNKGKETGIHVYSACTVTKGMEGKELSPLKTLHQAGAVCFTDDGKPILDEALVEKAMLLAKESDVPISFHEEDPAYIKTNGIHEGTVSEELGIPGSPREAEITMIARDCEIAIKTGAKVVIQHISSKEGVELVRTYKKKGASIYAEATPHHFSLTHEAVRKHGTYAKMNPPLREEEDRLAVIEGLKDGTISMIATDHAPHTKEEKAASEFGKAPSGIIGLETSLSLGIKNLVQSGALSMMDLMDRMSLGTASLYKLPAGVLQVGEPADLVIFDPKATKVAGDYASKAENTPFTGEELPGVVKYTICDGEIVYRG
ncbi:MAG: dihydroorotase [Lachnospiraceae bacterium]|nr:dihydroorotase [Lachnospiraceae bacterium]